MNGEPLPLEHGFPLRALALGWTGANCVKWLSTITLKEQPQDGFFMDKVYRKFQKGEDPASGQVVTAIDIKAIITAPENGSAHSPGSVIIRGAAYAGESDVDRVAVSVDDGVTWDDASFYGPHEPYAWRRWEYEWKVSEPGDYLVMARATDSAGREQPESAEWNVLGYGNNGVREHAVSVQIE